ELTIFCGSMTGASLGILWYNAHPAEIFMGDVGSLGLGGAMAVVAVLIKQEVLLLFIGGVFMLEALSVILQVGSFKLRHGKRIFKMGPIHHHFEALGWAELRAREGPAIRAAGLKPLEALPGAGELLERLRIPFARQTPEVFEGRDLIVLSPDVPADLAPLQEARQRGARA